MAKLPPNSTEIEKWLLFRHENGRSPVVAAINKLQEPQRAAVLRRLAHERKALDQLGIATWQQSSAATSPPSPPGQSIPNFHMIVCRPPSKMVVYLYLTFYENAPVLVHAASYQGNRIEYNETSKAAKALSAFLEEQAPTLVVDDAIQIRRSVTNAAIVEIEKPERTKRAQRSRAREAVPSKSEADVREAFVVEESPNRELIELKQDIATRLERVVAQRQTRRSQLLAKANSELKTALKQSSRGHKMLDEAQGALNKETKQRNRSVNTSNRPHPDSVSLFGRIGNIFRSLGRAPRSNTYSGEASSVSEDLSRANAAIDASQKSVTRARTAVQRYTAANIADLSAGRVFDDEAMANEVGEIKKLCKEARRLGIEFGHKLLSDPTFALPVVRKALGTQLAGDPSRPSTWSKDGNGEANERLALLAADISCFHFLHDMWAGSDEVAYGARSSYPAGAPRAQHDLRSGEIVTAQGRQMLTRDGRVISPGTGVDAAPSAAMESLDPVMQAVERAIIYFELSAARSLDHVAAR
jgi:hypothetical protein